MGEGDLQVRTHENRLPPEGCGRLSAQIIETCRRQRLALLCEREALHLARIMREHEARARMRKLFQQEADAVARKLLETVSDV